MSIADPTQLAQLVRDNAAKRSPLPPVDLRPLHRILGYHPEDMTVTVESGITLADLQTALATHRQWLPIDPPNPERITIADLIAQDLSGPRRHGYGTTRDWLLGLRAVTGEGQSIRSGGQVVKNVAGYDLHKLFIGAHHSLGFVVEATFKLLPRPEAESILARPVHSADATESALQPLLAGDLNPIVLDLHNLPSRADPTTDPTGARLVVGFAGATEDVAWQSARARDLGFGDIATLDHETVWQTLPGPERHRSLRPDRALREAWHRPPLPFVLRVGSGSLRWRGGPEASQPLPNRTLHERIKQTFDPARILPPLPW